MARLSSASEKKVRWRSAARIQRSTSWTATSTLALSRGAAHPRRYDDEAVVLGEVGVGGVEVGFVAMRPAHRRAQIVRDHALGDPAEKPQRAHVGGAPVRQGTVSPLTPPPPPKRTTHVLQNRTVPFVANNHGLHTGKRLPDAGCSTSPSQCSPATACAVQCRVTLTPTSTRRPNAWREHPRSQGAPALGTQRQSERLDDAGASLGLAFGADRIVSPKRRNPPCATSAPAVAPRSSISKKCSSRGSPRTAASTFPSGGRSSAGTSWPRFAVVTTRRSRTRSSPASPATPSRHRSSVRSSTPRTPSSGTPRWPRSRSSGRTTGCWSCSTGRPSRSRTSRCKCWAGSTTTCWSGTTRTSPSSAPPRETPAPPPSKPSRGASGSRSSSSIRRGASRRSSAGR